MVCGGAADTYVDCKNDFNSTSMTCDRNIECVTTTGNAQWCTGPKMKDCYVFEPYFSEEFLPVAKVKLIRNFYHLKLL